MQTRVYIFAEKILTLQKITPAILPFKNLTLEIRNGEGVSLDQSPGFLWKDFWTLRKLKLFFL